MRHTRLLLPFTLCVAGLQAQGPMVLGPPDWTSQTWRPVLVFSMPEFDPTASMEVSRHGIPPKRLKGMPGAMVEVVGRYERPLDHYLLHVMPRVNAELQQAFQWGFASRESVQILSQFMYAAPGKFIAEPASVWYNGTMPENLRWEGMWGVVASPVGHGIGPMGASKNQTLTSRGNNR